MSVKRDGRLTATWLPSLASPAPLSTLSFFFSQLPYCSMQRGTDFRSANHFIRKLPKEKWNASILFSQTPLISTNYSLKTTFTLLVGGRHIPSLQQERVAQATSLISRLFYRTSKECYEIFNLPMVVLYTQNRAKRMDRLSSRAYLTMTKSWEDVRPQLFGAFFRIWWVFETSLSSV